MVLAWYWRGTGLILAWYWLELILQFNKDLKRNVSCFSDASVSVSQALVAAASLTAVTTSFQTPVPVASLTPVPAASQCQRGRGLLKEREVCEISKILLSA